MKRSIKKILVFFLTFVMIFALLVPAYAENDGETAAPAEKTLSADEETVVSDETTAAEGESTAVTDETKPETEETTVAADETTKTEGETEAAPVETTAGAEGTEKVPEETEETDESAAVFALRAASAAEVGGTSYDTLEEAVTALTAGGTLTLLANIENTDYGKAIDIKLPAGAVLDGGGHTLSGNIKVTVAAGGATVRDVKFNKIHDNTNQLSAIYASGLTGTLTVTGCEFDSCDWEGIQTTPKAGAVVDIQGNTFRNTGKAAANRYVHVEATKKSIDFTATVTGNKFYDTETLRETALEVYYPKNASKVKVNENYMEGTPSTCIIISSTNKSPELAVPFVEEDLSTPVKFEAVVSVDTSNYHYYHTVQEAVDEAIDRGKGVLVVDDVTSSTTIPAGQSVTISAKGDAALGDFTIEEGAKLILSSGEKAADGAKIVNNGTFVTSCNAGTGYDVENNGAMKIQGGKGYDAAKIRGDGTLAVTSGTFVSPPPANAELLEWYTANEQKDGTYKIEKMTVAQALEHGLVASSSKTGGTYYTSAGEALTKASAYLQKDVEEEISLQTTDESHSLYLNKHNFTGAIDMGTLEELTLRGDSSTRENPDSAKLSNIKGQKLNVGTNTAPAKVTISDGQLEELRVTGSGVCSVENGSYGKVAVQNYYTKKADTEPKYTGTLTITGGTFESNEVSVERYNGNASKPAKTETVPLTDYIPVGYKLNDNGDGTYTVVADPAASIGDKTYPTLEAALAAAEDGDTVKILKDLTLDQCCEVAASVTIDLNEKTVTGPDAVADADEYAFKNVGPVNVEVKNGTVTGDCGFSWSDGSLTLTDMTVETKGRSVGNYDSSVVTIGADATVKSTGYAGVVIWGDGEGETAKSPVLNVYGTVESSSTTYPAISGNGTDRSNTTINIYDGGKVQAVKLAIYHPQLGTINMSGGTVSGYAGIGMKSGNLNITGGTVHGTANDNVLGDQYSQTNGIAYDGSAIVVDSYISYPGEMNIHISDQAEIVSDYSTGIREIGNTAGETNVVSLVIDGGTVKGAAGMDAVQVRQESVSGVDISGGSFSSIVPDEYCAESYDPVTEVDENGMYTVRHEHILVKTEAKAADCVAEGNIAYWTCSVCKKLFSDETGVTEITLADTVAAKLGHDYKAVVTAPTCTEKGYTTYTCSRCGDSYTADETAAPGHSYKDGVCGACGQADPNYQKPTNPAPINPAPTNPAPTKPAGTKPAGTATSAPPTGNENGMALWFLLLLLSGAGITGAVMADRKRTYHK